jgi:hypothetical protein
VTGSLELELINHNLSREIGVKTFKVILDRKLSSNRMYSVG